jgi:UDP-glucose 4-epimerase
MNCAVIGGGGFLGSHLTEALLNLGHKVVVLDRPNGRYLNELARLGASIVVGDFLRSDSVKGNMVDVDVVYHLASTTVPKTSNSDPAYDIETNLQGTINIFNAAKEAGVKKVIFSSSGGTVYGIPEEIPITEGHSTNPICSYGIVKLAIEKYLHLFWTLYGLDYCILRMSNVYGERQTANGIQGIIPTIIDKGLLRQEISIWGDGTVIRDYIHVSDVIEAFLKAITYKGDERIFNISSGQGHSVIEIINMIEGLLKLPLQIAHAPKVASDVLVNILDNTRAKLYLNWTPQMSFGDGISHTVLYMKDHQDKK